jgi:asparagine synthase (glutamine-hydrolysing)
MVRRPALECGRLECDLTMCGIAGKLSFDASREVGGAEIGAMLDPIAHRGPDGQGVYLDREAGLGHCRLAIVDVDGGPQPMANEDRMVWIVFNGEIYNHEELREGLVARGHVFRSRSDTEAILHLYEEYGDDCVNHLRGMFAFAIWDRKRRRLFAARDRVGIKPLYYCQTPAAFLFASEFKAILADPGVSRDLCPAAFGQFFAFLYVPGAETPFAAVRKLPPGHSLAVEGGRVVLRRYWSLRFTRERWDQPFGETVDELRALIGETVRSHLMADVPLGVLLSGGVDSSAILSLAVRGSTQGIKTFTVGFEGQGVVDERPYARLAAREFGTDHRDLSITAGDFWDFLPAYAWQMEEPVCEPPAVALYHVSRLARGHVKVLLSGEGGDEAFGGYPNYPNLLRLERIQRRLGPLARPLGALAGMAGGLLGSEKLRRYGGALGRPLADHYYSRSSSPSAYFNRTAALFNRDFLAVATPVPPAARMAEILAPVRDLPLLDQMLYADTRTWLPDDLLVKADKMTMANSVELRVPLLDHRVLEFAASLRTEAKVSGGETKRVLKAAFARVLPPEILARKKAGFPVPYGAWLRGPLADGVRDTLLSSRAAGRGYFRPGQVERLLERNRRTGDLSKEVFSLLVMELWHQRFVDAAGDPRRAETPPPRSGSRPAVRAAAGFRLYPAERPAITP